MARGQDDALVAALGEAVPAWIERCVLVIASAWADAGGALPDDLAERAHAAAARAGDDVTREVRRLVDLDIDEQRTTPLAIVRDATRFATEVLRDVGVPPVEREPFDEERFPGDRYALVPASMADVDESLGAVALAWGAAKAFEHKRRHGSAG